jgi:hypothetical protein
LELTPEQAERMIEAATQWGQAERKAFSTGAK